MKLFKISLIAFLIILLRFDSSFAIAPLKPGCIAHGREQHADAARIESDPDGTDLGLNQVVVVRRRDRDERQDGTGCGRTQFTQAKSDAPELFK